MTARIGKVKGRPPRYLTEAILLLFLAVAAPGCQPQTAVPEKEKGTAADSDEGSPRSGRKGGKPVAVPQPNLESVDEEVRQQIQTCQAQLDALRKRADAPTGELAAVYGELGKLYHTYRMFDAAELCYLNAQLLAPTAYNWPHLLGVLRRTKNNSKQASEAFEQALAIRAHSVPTLVGLAELCLEASQSDRAETLFGQALAADPKCAAALVGLGKIAASRRDFVTAVQHFESALVLQPRATAIHYALAMAYRGLGDLDKAQTHLSQRGEVVVKVPDPLLAELARLRIGARIHEKRGLSAGKAGRLTTALGELRKAVEKNPDRVTARINLGTALALMKQPEAAATEYRMAIRLNPEFTQAYYNLAVVLGQQGSTVEAIESFRKAIELDPQSLPPHLGIAEQLIRLGEYQQAASYYARAVGIDPRHPAARLAEAKALAQAGQYAAAWKRFEDARAVLPRSLLLTHGRARLLAASPDASVRDGPQARQLALVVFQTRRSAEHAATVAMACAEVGQYQEAVTWQERAMEIARQESNSELLRQLQENLALYKNQRPCRLPWPWIVPFG